MASPWGEDSLTEHDVIPELIQDVEVEVPSAFPVPALDVGLVLPLGLHLLLEDCIDPNKRGGASGPLSRVLTSRGLTRL